jgi:hypothetical protein
MARGLFRMQLFVFIVNKQWKNISSGFW